MHENISNAYPWVNKVFGVNGFHVKRRTLIGYNINIALVIGPASKGQVTVLLTPRPFSKVDRAEGSVDGWWNKDHIPCGHKNNLWGECLKTCLDVYKK